MAPLATMSRIFISTMSQPRSLLSIARSNSARSRNHRCSSRKKRIAHRSRSFSGRFVPIMPPVVLMGLTARELAGKLETIEHVNVTPDLLASLMSEFRKAPPALVDTS